MTANIQQLQFQLYLRAGFVKTCMEAAEKAIADTGHPEAVNAAEIVLEEGNSAMKECMALLDQIRGQTGT